MCDELRGEAFDWTAVRNAYLAGDYVQCRLLLEDAPAVEAQIWLARMEHRTAKNTQALARLLKITPPNDRIAAERDLWLAAVYSASDGALAHRLLDRVLPTLNPSGELHFRALYIRALAHFFAGELDADEQMIELLLKSPYPLDRAQAYSHRSWIWAKRENLRAQLRDLVSSLDETERAPVVDQYALVHTLVTLGVLCRELPTEGVIERVYAAAERVQLHEVTAFPFFQLARVLAWADALQGDQISAMRRFHTAEETAPSQYWFTFCLVDRAYLANAMGRTTAAREALALADEHASALDWSSTQEDERIALVTMAELLAAHDPARAERYLAQFRSLGTDMHPGIGWIGDRRTRALQLYAQGSAMVQLGERETGVAMLQEAWEIFTAFEYGWRAALAALGIYRTAGPQLWLDRAREQIAPWPNSWIARDVRNAG